MPSTPTLNDIHVDSALTDFSLAYFQQSERFVAPRIFPVTNVPKRSGRYFTYDMNEIMRSDAAKRAPGTEAKVRGFKLSNDPYHCEVYSIAVDVSEQEPQFEQGTTRKKRYRWPVPVRQD